MAKNAFYFSARLVLGVSLLLAGCSSTTKGGQDMNASGDTNGSPVVLVETNAADTTQLKAGASFSVRLASNPTTGFRWHLTPLPEGCCISSKGKSTYEQDPAPAGMMGVGGNETFSFVAMKPGM